MVLGFIGLVLDLRWYLNSNMMIIDGAIASGPGFLSIVKQQFGRLWHGNPPPSDPTQASAGASSDFGTALLLIMMGSAQVLLGKSTVENIFS
jgi:hypothetical protein